MALNFPSSPTNGQIYTYGGITYYFDLANSAWTVSYVQPTAGDPLAYAYTNTKVATVASNGSGRLWANTTVDGTGNENVYIDLATSGVTATTYGGSTNIPVLVVDAYGRITTASNIAVQGMDYAFANTKVATVASNGSGRLWANSTVDSNGNENVYIDLATSGVTASIYGGSTQIPVITIDTYGRITAASNIAVQGMDYAFTNTAANSANAYAQTYANNVGTAVNTNLSVAVVSANTWANTKLSNTSGVVFAGNLYFPTGNVSIGYATDQNFKLAINGNFVANTKSFLIAHPTKPGMQLRYASLEGPENGVYVRGKVDGINVIRLPDYWEGLVDLDTITVNLTAVGHPQNLYVSAIDGLKIHIDTENHTQPYCYYHVYAERKDVDKLVVEY